MPSVADLSLGFLGLMWLACIVAAAYGAYTGLVKGEMFWPGRGGPPKRLTGLPARIGGGFMTIFALGLLVPVIRAFYP